MSSIRNSRWVASACVAGVVLATLSTAAAAQSDSGPANAIVNEVLDNLGVGQADKHWHAGEYNHVVNICRIVVAGRPDSLDAYANAGWLLCSMKRNDEAEALYKQGLRANPNTWYMYDELGRFCMDMKRYREAAGYYERAVTFKDATPTTSHMLAHAYEKSGQMEKALKTWEAVVAKDPADGAAKLNLNRVRRQMGLASPN